MMLREYIAWFLVALLTLACVGIEWQRVRLSVEVENFRALEERVKEHNHRAIERVLDGMYKVGGPSGCLPSSEASAQNR
jgi:hypothetical protein